METKGDLRDSFDGLPSEKEAIAAMARGRVPVALRHRAMSGGDSEGDEEAGVWQILFKSDKY